MAEPWQMVEEALAGKMAWNTSTFTTLKEVQPDELMVPVMVYELLLLGVTTTVDVDPPVLQLYESAFPVTDKVDEFPTQIKVGFALAVSTGVESTITTCEAFAEQLNWLNPVTW